jgi:hypothetical protein
VCIVLVLAIGGISYYKHQKRMEVKEEQRVEQLNQEAKTIEKSVDQGEYTKTSTLLKNPKIGEIQPYSQYDFHLIKDELKSAIQLQNLFNKGEYKEYLSQYNLNPIQESHLDSYAKDHYVTSVSELLKNGSNQEKMALGDLINYEYLSLGDANKIREEITIASAIEYYNEGNLEEITYITADPESEGTVVEGIYHVVEAKLSQQQGAPADTISLDLVKVPEFATLPEPFNSVYVKLMNQYEDTEDFEIAKQVVEESEAKEGLPSRPAIGMTADEVRSIWGIPTDVNRTETVNGVSEQWVYTNGYVYLDNGVVTAIQD